MTVAELLKVLLQYPPDMKLVLDSADQGCHDLEGVQMVTVMFNVRKDSGFEGPHQAFSEDDLELYTQNPEICPECKRKRTKKALLLVPSIKKLGK
jgi:hypothetical protein